MIMFEESLHDLLRGVRTANVQESARRQADLVAVLETMVRCALRNGTGLPGLVRWVDRTLPTLQVAGGGQPAEDRAVPILARLLNRTLVKQSHRQPVEVAQAGYATVVGY